MNHPWAAHQSLPEQLQVCITHWVCKIDAVIRRNLQQAELRIECLLTHEFSIQPYASVSGEQGADGVIRVEIDELKLRHLVKAYGFQHGRLTCDDCDHVEVRNGQSVQLIIKAFVDVFLLRRGPEDIPKSSLLLAMAIGASIVVNFLFYAIVESEYGTDLFLEFATELVKIVSYVGVLLLFGLVSRIMQTITAIIACNAILGLLLTAVLMVSQPFMNKELDAAFAWLVTFWLILVEGHIISRAIQLHWITGIAIAVVIFILQLGFYFTFGELPEAAAS